MNNQGEADFIKQWQTGFNQKESYWIGGSSSTEFGNFISLSEYITGDAGNITVADPGGSKGAMALPAL